MALARAWKQMSWFYYQYLLVTALYMLEPWERTVFSILPRPRARGPGWGSGSPGRILPGSGASGWGVEAGGRRVESRPCRDGARADSPLRCGHAGRRSGAEGGAPVVGEGVGLELLRSEGGCESL